MKVDLFDFELPPERIALRPARPRDAARMLVVPKEGPFENRGVRDLPNLLRAGDILVFNDTRVIPAQLEGRRGQARIGATLHKRIDLRRWQAFVRNAKRLRVGDVAEFGGGVTAIAEQRLADGSFVLHFEGDEPVNYNGRLAFQSSLGGPKWVGDADLRFSFGDITFRYGLQYVGPMDGNEFVEEGLLAAPVVDGDPVDFDLLAEEYFEHDISVQFRIQDLGQLTLGVNNVFNNKPSVISSAGGFPRIGNYFNYSGYDIIGRSFFLNMTRSF